MFFYVNCHLISKLQAPDNHGEKVLEPALKQGSSDKSCDFIIMQIEKS